MMKRGKQPDRTAGYRFGIVAATFNKPITSQLLESCVATFAALGVDSKALDVVRVPGAFEIPLVARTMAKSGRFDAVICLGAVIRGDTPHFEYISAEVSRGIGQAALDTDVPIIFGVLTTDSEDQAAERADPQQFNRGGEAAKSAIDMATVMRKLRRMANEAPTAMSVARKKKSLRSGRARAT